MVKQLKNKPKGLFFLPIILMITLCVFMSVVSADSPLTEWTQRTSSFSTSYIYSIATDGTTWVAVGDSGKLATATDPTGTWTQRTSSFSTSHILSIATDGTTWVAVGQSGKLATTTDPTGTWTQRTSSFDSTNIYSIATDGTTWVAVGQSGKLATATDPTGTWTQRTSSFDSTTIYSIATDGTTWVAVGQSGKLTTATDPTGPWTQRTSSFDLTHIRSIATDGETWVAVGWDGKLATATDPTGTWTQRTSSFDSTNIYSIATDGTTWVAVGDSGKLATATDPTGTWTQRTSSFDSTTIYSIATDGETWVAGGYYGKLATAENTIITRSTISNPTLPIYPTISYDWNGSFIDDDYNSDYTYKYSFGFNYTNSFDGNEIYIDTNQSLDYDQNTIKYFDLNYTPTTDEIGDMNYSFFKVYRYLDEVYDSNYTSWSENTFEVLDNIDINFTAPAYPDWANIFYPTKSYSGSAHYQDKSYQSGVTTYKYDFGSNDTNSLDGGEEYWEQNADIDSDDGNVNAYFEHTLSEDDKGKTLYAFITVKRYNDGVFEDSETYWTDSFDVNYGRFRVQFYDGNSGGELDGNVHLENTVTIPVDENGLVDIWLDQYITTDGQAIEAEAWREVDGVVTHTQRDFDYYLYLTRSYDLNASLLPIDIGADIEFLVKDLDDTLWANKYLMFVNGVTEIYPEAQQLISTYISETGTTTNKRGVRFSVNEDFYITAFNIEQGTNPVDSWELWNYTLGTLIDSGTGLNSTTTVVDTRTAIKLDTNYEYSIVLFNDGGSAKFPYQLNQLNTPVNTEYIEYTDGCDNGALSCTSNNAYIITDVVVMDANNYDVFFSSPIAEVKKLGADGKGTFYLMADGNYSAILIDEMGTITRQYQKTTVNLKKPKDEITNASISPYDVDIGGLLVYSLSNQTDAELNFNIFAGTTGYYDFTVVDYNTTPTDRDYIPRNYSVRINMGSNYIEEYDLQPYLISDIDGIIPKIKVIDQLNRSVNNAIILVYKYIDGAYTVVESGITDSTGAISWAAYPLDSYIVAVYYQEELKGNYVIRPRTSDDVYWIQIDLGEDAVVEVPDLFQINWGDTKDFFNLNSELVEVDNAVIQNAISNITGYTVSLYQGSVLIDSHDSLVDVTNTININQIFDTETINTAYRNAEIRIEVEYGAGETKEFVRQISISRRTSNPLTYFQGAADDLGQPLAAIIAIFLTGLLLAMLTFNGLPLDKTGVAILGIFSLGIFMWFGWLDSGVTVLGFDISRFAFIIIAMAIAFFAFKESVR